MSAFINGVITGAPAWVWPLLVALLYIGWASSKDRDVPRSIFFVLPFFGAITVSSVLNLPVQSIAWPCYVAGYLAGAYVSYGLQSRWLERREGARLFLSGEWYTMATLMVVFWVNFVRGFMEAVLPNAYASAEFIAPFAIVIGFVSGSFLGRSIRSLTYQGSIIKTPR